jgi:pyruvate,water dikinase
VQWLSRWDAAKDPWFHFSCGNGLASHHRSWIDDTSLPLATVASYIERLEAGEAISRPRNAVIAERDRITAEYRELMPESTRVTFDERLALARTVFPYVENHSFYVDHWYLTVFWNKVREFGALLASRRFLEDADDVFYLRHDEVREALQELRLAWSSGDAGAVTGPQHWPAVVMRRKSIHEAQRRWAPPMAVGATPEAIDDPVTIMLFGVTSERVRGWLTPAGGPGTAELSGIAASPGVAEGRARVIAGPKQLAEVEDGEILVAASTSPSWTPVFGRVSAVVVDIGGIMSHAAIVAREYGLPTVVGTGSAAKTIQTGDRIRVDGDTGVVTVLD